VFFERAVEMSNQPIDDLFGRVFLESVPGEERSTLPMIKITSLVCVLVGGNYWLASIYFSIFSFCAAFYLTHQLTQYWPEYKLAAVAAFLFFPSTVFWSAGILKESVVFGLICYLSAVVISFYVEKRVSWLQIVLCIVSAWWLILLKYYIAGIFLGIALMLVFNVIFKKYLGHKISHSFTKIGIGLVVLVLVMVGMSSLHYNLGPGRILEIMRTNQEAYLSISNASNIVSYFDDSNSYLFLSANALIALFAGLFLPLWPADVSLMQYPAIIENILLFVCFLLSFKRRWSFNREHFMLIGGCFAYVLVSATMLAYATPNLGTLSRYKVYFIPFFVLFILIEHPWLTGKKEKQV
jgi:hypothetical protein